MTTRAALFVGSVTLMTVLASSGPTWAQDTGDVARRLVGEGIEAARSRDWITAKDRFARAYDIQPLPLTLYNLAAAQEKTGELVEADKSYRIFLRETTPGENDDFRRIALDRRKALKSKICYVVLTAENLEDDDVLTLGTQEISHAVLGESLPSNPGTLNIRVERHGEVIKTERVALAEGATKRVRIELPAYQPPVATNNQPAASGNQNNRTAANNNAGSPATTGNAGPTDSSPSEASEDEGSGGISPVVWGVVGAVGIGAVLLVAAGVAGAGGAAVAYISPSDTPVTSSTIEPVTIEGR